MIHIRRNYEVLPLEEALSLLDTGALPRGAVSITFDDGYRELMDGAFHILQDLNLPATVFLVVGHVGTDLPFWWEEVAFRLKMLNKEALAEFLRTLDLQISVGRPDWIPKIIEALKGIPTDLRDKRVDNLRELTGEVRLSRMSLTWEEVRKAQSWGISFGSHSMTHPILTLLGDEALEREIQISRETIESMTGASCHLLAYPNGDHDDRVRAAARRAGYWWAVTMERGRNEPGTNPLALRRHPVYAHYSQPWFAAVLRGWLDLPPWVFRLVSEARNHKMWPSISLNRMI
jgi:peptidoglycan/xylan/chitin deacetylase (PgdA/CDA1 family)